VTADHGEELYERGWIGHNVHLFEPSVHVPLVIHLPPGLGPEGGRIEALTDLLDLAPTIADVFGALEKAGGGFQGRSLLPVISGAPGRPAVLSRTVWDRPRYALRDDRFKFFYDTRTGEERLFDLDADPGEGRDVASEQPLRASFYRQALHNWTLRLGQRGPSGSEAVTLSADQCANLRALGYVEECP